MGDSVRLGTPKFENRLLVAAGDVGLYIFRCSPEVCRGGKDVWSYGWDEDECDPMWLLRSLDSTADGAILDIPTDVRRWQSIFFYFEIERGSSCHASKVGGSRYGGFAPEVPFVKGPEDCCDFGLGNS
jgi:hypothetical protein